MQKKGKYWRGILSSQKRSVSRGSSDHNKSQSRGKRYTPKVQHRNTAKLFASKKHNQNNTEILKIDKQLEQRQRELLPKTSQDDLKIQFVQRLKTHTEQLMSPVKKSGHYKLIPKSSKSKIEGASPVKVRQLEKANAKNLKNLTILKDDFFKFHETLLQQLKMHKNILRELLQQILLNSCNNTRPQFTNMCCVRSQFIQKALTQLDSLKNLNMEYEKIQKKGGANNSGFLNLHQIQYQKHTIQSQLKDSKNKSGECKLINSQIKSISDHKKGNVQNFKLSASIAIPTMHRYTYSHMNQKEYSQNKEPSENRYSFANSITHTRDLQEFSKLFQAVSSLKKDLRELGDMKSQSKEKQSYLSKSVNVKLSKTDGITQ